MQMLERMGLIDKIGRELQSRMTYSDINIYLSGYGIDTSIETSDGGMSKWVYVKDLLATVPEQTVIAIAEELGISYSNSEQSPFQIQESSYWLPNYFRLFLSHLSSYKEKTAQLQEALKPFGISSFVAHSDIEPTAEWQNEIEFALLSMDAVAAILTPAFNESKWTDQEIGAAIGRNLLVIPVRKGMDPYGFIGKYQGFQGDSKTIGDVAEGIFKIISSHPKTKERMSSALAGQILFSDNPSQAISKLNLLRSIESLPQNHLEKIRDNINNNRIVMDSHVFIDTLNEMLKERELDALDIIEQPEELFDSDIPF